MDLRANLIEPVLLKYHERILVKTGLFIQIPSGYEAQVRPRSGLALKNGISVLNSPGTIDSDYRGEIGVILVNLSKEDFKINNGERIAQLVFSAYSKVDFVEVKLLDASVRGVGGFGSSGIK
jgi:dUTP pyrophosphatase